MRQDAMRKIPGVMWLVCAMVAGLAACERPEDRITFNGFYFRAKSAPVDKKVTLAEFIVSVKDVSQSIDGARAAGGYEGTTYCIKNFGTSRIKWAVGPATPPENLRIADDTLIFQGTCDPR